MNEEIIYELRDIDKAEDEDKEIYRIVDEQLNHASDIINGLHDIIRQVSERISREDFSESKKQLILYRFMTEMNRGIIGYTLSIDGSIAVTQTVLEKFKAIKFVIENEKNEKVDRFSNKKFK